jgi:hypothetical protein
MNVHFPVRRSQWPGRIVQLAVIVVVTAVAAATFVLSYAGVHEVALQAGVAHELARYYPGILDAVLVIACAAAPVLREARWWVRAYAWLAILVVIGVIGVIDAVHAMNVALPHRTAAGVAAVLPWALLLLAFSLWLTILRHLRAQPSARAAGAPDAPRVMAAPRALAAAAAPAVREADTATADTGVPGTDSAVPGTDCEVPGTEGAEVPAERSAAPATEGFEIPPTREELPMAPVIGVAQETATDPEPGEEPATAAGPETEPGPEPGHARETGPEPEGARETVTGIPAITHATGPRLRRVRSLPAPPVDDEDPQP